MIITIGGGAEGIAEYLLKGRKAGREETREQLDDRLILDGDLDITNTIISSMKTEGQKYLHITLSFAEDRVEADVLRSITQEFKEFIHVASQEDEYNFYAEAHLPRIKRYRNVKDGSLIERLTHIHVVIPEINLATGERLNPVGMVDRYRAYIDAFQESVNIRYGLASPKDEEHQRGDKPSQALLLSRYKGDEYDLPNKELRIQILKSIVETDAKTKDDLYSLLASMGEVKVRNEGKANAYFNLKVPGAAKGVNLKAPMYTDKFLKLTKEHKQSFLEGVLSSGPRKEPKRDLATYEGLIKEWKEWKAFEVKHIKFDKRKYQLPDREPVRYADLTEDEQRQVVRSRAKAYQKKIASKRMVEVEDIIEPTSHHQTEAQAQLPRESLHREKPVASVAEGALDESRRDQQEQTDTFLSEWQVIKRDLDPRRLLNKLEATHGVDPSKYTVTVGKDGTPRIGVGKRNYSVSDFLTKELHLEWHEAATILRATYKEQLGKEPQRERAESRQNYWQLFIAELKTTGKENRDKAWEQQRASEKERRTSINQLYQLKRKRLEGPPAERQAAGRILQMEKVQDHMNLRRVISEERELLKQSQKKPLQELFAVYLERMFELEQDNLKREMIRKEAERVKIRLEREAREKEEAIELLRYEEILGATTSNLEMVQPGKLDLRLRIEVDGSITYIDNGRDFIRDGGNKVSVLNESDDRAVEACILLGREKFGRNLQFFGPPDFIERALSMAVDKGIKLELGDQAQMRRYQELYEEKQRIWQKRQDEPLPSPTRINQNEDRAQKGPDRGR